VPATKKRVAKRQKKDADAWAEARVNALAEQVARKGALSNAEADREFATDPIRSTLHRCRHVFAPVLVMLGMLAAAAMVQLAGWVTGMRVQVALIASVLAWLAAAAAYAGGRRALGEKNRGLRWRVALAAGFAASWLTVTVWRGIDWTGATVLFGGGWLLSAFWLRRYRPTVTAKQAQTIGRSYGQLWRNNVACSGGVAPGSRVLNSQPVLDEDREKIGVGLTVELVAGKQTIGDLHSRITRIAGGLKTRVANLVIEDLPDQHPDDDDPNLIRVQIITKSPIRETVFFTEPRWSGGEILLGPYADGVGEATFRLYTRKSMWGGFILGSTGSGKSRLMEAIALVARSMSNTVIVYIDGQDGASSPTLKKHADWFGGREEAPEILTALERIYSDRNQENIDRDLTGFTPSKERPGILVIVDECHEIFANSKMAKRWGNLSRAGRKVGVALLASSQAVDLPVFGNYGPLRDSLYAGNKIVMHLESRESKQLVTGLEMDPADLPGDMPGYGYTVQSTESGGRTAPFRGYFLPDAEDLEEDPEIPVPTLEQWMWQIPSVGLDAPARTAAGKAYSDRAKKAREKRQLWEGRRRGEIPWETHEAAESVQESLEFPAPSFGTFVDPDALTEPQQRLLDVIRDGVERPKAMREATQWSETRVRQLLGELIDRGAIQRVGKGPQTRYQLAGVPA
jgi:energy-coupling factor transporter ATP-binding protein EcfA2